MTFKKFLAVSVSALALAPAVASAQDENVYLGLGAGAAFEHDSSFSVGTSRNSVDYDWGWGAEAALGYRFGNGFRTELEVAYRGNNDVDSVSGALIPSKGDSSSWAAMLNVLYDVDVFDNERFMPYVGAGFGAIRSQYDNVGPALGLATSIDDSSFDFGWQAMAGLTYQATDMLDVYAQYKYTSAINPDYNAIAVSNVSGDYDVSTIVAGIRINFNPPPPAPAPVAAAPEPMPAPEPMTSRNYIVFFDFDRYDLTPEAREIIRQAAADAKAGNAIQMDVRGHADRSGSDQYNQRLSARRAEAVRQELARNGVNISAIQTSAVGEREPLVPTRDGVKEPQNRRAEIMYNR